MYQAPYYYIPGTVEYTMDNGKKVSKKRREKSKFVCQFPLSILLVIQHHLFLGGSQARQGQSGPTKHYSVDW